MDHISLSQCTCYLVRGGVLSIRWGNPLCHVVVLHVGKRSERQRCHLVSSCPCCKWLAVSPAGITPTDFNSQRFWGFIFPTLEPWVSQSALLRSCSSWFISTQMWDCSVFERLPWHASSPPGLPISVPPTNLDECFFFYSLVVGIPYSLSFWHFWLILFLNWLLPSFSCARRQSLFTYTSILARTPLVRLDFKKSMFSSPLSFFFHKSLIHVLCPFFFSFEYVKFCLITFNTVNGFEGVNGKNF